MDDSNITKKPKRRTEDMLHTIAKAGLASIPIIGVASSPWTIRELFENVVNTN